MDGFLDQALAEQGVIPVEAVEFLAEAVERNQSTRASHLCLPENIFQDGDIEIDAGDAEKPPVPWTHQSPHALENFRRMILLPLNMVSRNGVEFHGQDLTAGVQRVTNRNA